MNRGRIEQVGTADEVFEHPANELRHGLPRQRQRASTAASTTGASTSRIWCSSRRITRAPRAARPRVFVRPHELEVHRSPNGKPSFPATIVRVHAAGTNVRLELVTPSGEPVHVESPAGDVPEPRGGSRTDRLREPAELPVSRRPSSPTERRRRLAAARRERAKRERTASGVDRQRGGDSDKRARARAARSVGPALRDRDAQVQDGVVVLIERVEKVRITSGGPAV